MLSSFECIYEIGEYFTEEDITIHIHFPAGHKNEPKICQQSILFVIYIYIYIDIYLKTKFKLSNTQGLTRVEYKGCQLSSRNPLILFGGEG